MNNLTDEQISLIWKLIAELSRLDPNLIQEREYSEGKHYDYYIKRYGMFREIENFFRINEDLIVGAILEQFKIRHSLNCKLTVTSPNPISSLYKIKIENPSLDYPLAISENSNLAIAVLNCYINYLNIFKGGGIWIG